MGLESLFCVFTHVASTYANLLEQKKAFTEEKSSNPTGFVWDTNMAAVSLFWDTNMAAMTSCENTQYSLIRIGGMLPNPLPTLPNPSTPIVSQISIDFATVANK